VVHSLSFGWAFPVSHSVLRESQKRHRRINDDRGKRMVELLILLIALLVFAHFALWIFLFRDE